MPPRFGEVWTIKDTIPEDLPPVPYLVVSNDLYNDSGLGVIMAEIDVHAIREAEIHEPIDNLGTAMLDRMAWYPLRWLGEKVGELPAARVESVRQRVINLFT